MASTTKSANGSSAHTGNLKSYKSFLSILMEASRLACYVSSSTVAFLEAITEESERPSLDRGMGVRWPDRHAVCVSQELETSRTIVAILLHHHVLGTTACDVQRDDRGMCVVSWTHSHSRWQERKTQRDKDTGLHKKRNQLNRTKGREIKEKHRNVKSIKQRQKEYKEKLNLIVLMWRIGWAHNNARK